MLFLRVKISCLRAKAHLAFQWCLYNKMEYAMCHLYFHGTHTRLKAPVYTEKIIASDSKYTVTKAWYI